MSNWVLDREYSLCVSERRREVMDKLLQGNSLEATQYWNCVRVGGTKLNVLDVPWD